MSSENKKISLNFIIDSLNKVSGAINNDFMGESDSHTACIEKAIGFLIEFDLLNSSKIDFDHKAKDNGSN